MYNKTNKTYGNTKKLKPGLVAFYDIWPGNGMGLFSKKCINKKVNKHAQEDKQYTVMYIIHH